MKHYIRLDGLRCIAALVVVWYHLFEGFATSPIDQRCNHGYLAVDFFFLLSGFVLSYAYDGRLRSISAAQRLSFGSFLRRRIIRLHPMLLLGLVWGAVAFVLQGSVQWDGTAVSSICVIIALLTSLVLIPAWPGCPTEVRGNGEMFPLNGPMWSLFFEYVASILYGVVLHRLSTKVLYLLALLFAGGLSAFALCNLSESYHIGVGWTLAGMNFPGGLLRVLFSFTMGMYLQRTTRTEGRGLPFLLCAALLGGLLILPYPGMEANIWNGIYDLLCVLVVFPMIIRGAVRANGEIKALEMSVCRWLGNISYPLYIIHYPAMYLCYAYLWGQEPHPAFSEVWPMAVGLFIGNILLAHLCFKFYDAPARKWLGRQ